LIRETTAFAWRIELPSLAPLRSSRLATLAHTFLFVGEFAFFVLPEASAESQGIDQLCGATIL
jgi:hypothetical protein